MVVQYFDGLVTHEKVNKKETFISCQCESEIVRLSRFENEDEVYFTVYQYASDKYSFWERLKMLFWGKVRTCDLVLSSEDFNKIKQF